VIHIPKVLHEPAAGAILAAINSSNRQESAVGSTGSSDVDVVIVGAGLSGIGAACHLQREAPGTSYVILEARDDSGGTWDLFRYPGVRSDTDIFTFGYSFRPWLQTKAIVDGAEILRYIRETAAEYGVNQHIRYHARVVAAEWNSAEARWTVTLQDAKSGTRTTRRCRFLYLCSGYYRYDQGYTPTWPGREQYTGTVVHPQDWPNDLDVDGKRVVVIGSGATAVTLVPALAGAGAQVTMLQRSPSFVLSLPVQDSLAGLFAKLLPKKAAYAAIRWKNVKLATAIYQLSRRYPARARTFFQKGVAKQLPAGYDIDKHFTPTYAPWDQRLCLVPEGDLFTAIRSGKADVVTDHVESYTATGLRLRSGATIDADVIVAATGLNLLTMGGVELRVNGELVVVPDRVVYKGMMLDGVPNLAFALGYTNLPWTLKVDRVSTYLARLIAFMERKGYAAVAPRKPSDSMQTSPFIEMSSGYFERSRQDLPRQGDRAPWRLQQHYAKDAPLYEGRFDDGELSFDAPVAARNGP
jgi:monooxygenase